MNWDISTNRAPLSKPELYTYRDQENGAQHLLEFLAESRLGRFPGTQPQGTLYHFSRSQAKKMMSSMALHLPNTTGTGLKYILTNHLFPKAKITILNQWVGKHWDLYLKYGIGKTIFLPKTNVKKTATLAHSLKWTLHPTTYFWPLVAPWRSHSFSPRKTKHSTNPSHQK